MVVANPAEIFDTRLRRARRNRARAAPQDAGFLSEWAQKEIAARLEVINREFPLALQTGYAAPLRSSKISTLLRMDIAPGSPGINFTAEEEFFPLRDASLDLAISNLSLHAVNDLPGALIQIRRALKPDGLFMAALFGGETLYELRQTLMHTEMEFKGGASPRIFPFADKPQMGSLMQRAGFSLPVVDSEILTVTYENMFALLADLRAMGEGNIIRERAKTFAGRDFFAQAAKYYQDNFSDADGRIRASFEIIFLAGWAPHQSQQKPLRPGSAKTRLADALGAEEIKTGEQALP